MGKSTPKEKIIFTQNPQKNAWLGLVRLIQVNILLTLFNRSTFIQWTRVVNEVEDFIEGIKFHKMDKIHINSKCFMIFRLFGSVVGKLV